MNPFLPRSGFVCEGAYRFAVLLGPRAGRRGFTLVEVLVASTVLVVLVLLTSQLVNNATGIVNAGDKRMDADGKSRAVFMRMAQDIEGMLRRPDADLFFVKNTGNDAFYFYSQSLGSYLGGEGPPAPYAFVGYRIANRSNPTALAPNGVLERVGIGLGYDNAQAGKVFRSLAFPAASASATPLPVQESTLAWTQGADGNPASGNAIGTPPTWDNPPYVASNQALLSSEVFRLEFCFLLDDGTYYVPPVPGGQPWSNADYFNATTKIKSHAVSLLVTMALLDQKSQLLLPRSSTNTPDFTKVTAAFVDGDNADVAATWLNSLQSSLASPGAAMSNLGMPAAAAAQVRIYQRSFRFVR